MNSFIASKLKLVFYICCGMLLILSAGLAIRQYDLLLQEQIQHQFNTENDKLLEFNQALETQLSKLKAHGQLLKAALQSQQTVAEPNSGGKAYKIDLVNKKSEQLNQVDQSIVGKNYPLIEQSLALLSDSSLIKNAFFVWQGRNQVLQFVSDDDSFQLPTEVLAWLTLHSHQNQKHLDTIFFSPPFKIAKTNRNRNYAIYSFQSKGTSLFLLLELTPDLFALDQALDIAASTVVWHSQSGFWVYSNVESQRNKYLLANNPLLAVTSLPLSMQKQIIYQQPNQVGKRSEVVVDQELQLLIVKNELSQGHYRVLMFKSLQGVKANVSAKALSYGLAIFCLGLAILVVFVVLIAKLLALPASKLVEFIERQSSVFEVHTPDIPKGWHLWFDKVQSSFQDNRDLLQSLTDKNKELDNKVKTRTRALMQQTISKDRNLALNRAMMNTIPDSLYYKNVSGGYLGCNQAYEQLINMSEAALVAKTASDIFPPQKAAAIEAVEQAIISQNKIHIEDELVCVDEHTKRHIRWLYSPITNSTGEVLGMLGLGQDITEQQANIEKLSLAAQEAQRANQVKGEFIANISHEIRTPMNSIIGMLQLLQESKLDSSQSRYIKIAETSATSLLSVINNILDFSKASAEKLEVEQEKFSLIQVLESAFANSAASAMEKGVIVDTLYDSDVPEFFIGDEVKLSQIFTNLISNAVKFTEQGSVLVKVKLVADSQQQQTLSFEIEDTGIGIAPEQQKKVFEAFSQADNSVTRKYGGTGLGLTITYQLVELLNGQIELNSEPGVGTKFSLSFDLTKVEQVPWQKPTWSCYYHEPDDNMTSLVKAKLTSLGLAPTPLPHDEQELTGVLIARPEVLGQLPTYAIDKIMQRALLLQPLAYQYNSSELLLSKLPHLPVLTAPANVRTMLDNVASGKVMTPSQTVAKPKQLAGTKLLLVEDNAVNQQVLLLMLESEGAQVTVSNNGAEALEQLALEDFDVLLTDVQMPIMDGISLTRKLSRDNHYQIPIIVISAHTSGADVAKSLAAGAQKHLSKPVNKTELIAVIRQLYQDKIHDFSTLIEPEINAEFLLTQFQHSAAIARKVLLAFFNSQQAEFSQLCEHSSSWPLEQVKRKVHSYKGMLGNIGAELAYQATVQFEQELKTMPELDLTSLANWQRALERLFNVLAQLQQSSD